MIHIQQTDVAFPVCPAITGIGYPDYALSPWGEQGYYNIAVFYGGCNMDCLYCQNWEYREMIVNSKPVLSIESLVNAVNKKTSCVCFSVETLDPSLHMLYLQLEK